MPMNGSGASVWDGKLRNNCNLAWGAWQRRWWQLDGRDGSTCFCTTSGIETLLVQFSKDIYCEKALEKLSVTMYHLLVSEVLPVTEPSRLLRAIQSCYMPFNCSLDSLGSQVQLLVSYAHCRWDVWLGGHNMVVYASLEAMHLPFYRRHPVRLDGYEVRPVLEMNSPHFFYFQAQVFVRELGMILSGIFLSSGLPS